MIKILAACAAVAAGAVTSVVVGIPQAGSAASPPRCTAGQLRPIFNVVGGGGGHLQDAWLLRNMGASRCQLSGFPEVHNYRADGRSLPTTVTHTGTPQAVILLPGQRASFTLMFADPSVTGCTPEPAEMMTIRVPNTGLPVIGDHGVKACKGALTETPLVHGFPHG